MTYAEKLKDPRWQKRRLEIFERARWMCDNCGDDKSQLQVHHKLYIRNRDPWDYEDIFLESLCESCHSERTAFFAEFNFGLALLDQGQVEIVDGYVSACLLLDGFEPLPSDVPIKCKSYEWARGFADRFGTTADIIIKVVKNGYFTLADISNDFVETGLSVKD